MVRKKLKELGYKIEYEFGYFGIVNFEVKNISFLEKNANFLSKEKMEALKKNINKDGELSTLPLVVFDEIRNNFVVISGNHRIQALRELQKEKVTVIVALKILSKDDILRIQLSHNAIKGVDDKDILKELMAEIKDIDCLEMSGANFNLQDLKTIDNIKLEAVDFNETEAVLFFNVFEWEKMLNNFKLSIAEGKKIIITDKATKKDILNEYAELTKQIGSDDIINLKYVIPLVLEMTKNYKQGNDEPLDDEVFCKIGDKIKGGISKEAFFEFKKKFKNLAEFETFLLKE